MSIYTLWDTESARQLGEYTAVEDALDVVRSDIERGHADLWHGGALVQLTGEDEDEDIILLEGDALIARARGASGGTPPSASALLARASEMSAVNIVRDANLAANANFAGMLSRVDLSGVRIAANANLAGMLPRIDLAAFGIELLGIKSITESLNEFTSARLPRIDMASFGMSPSLADTMREFTQVRWSDHVVAMETPLAKLLADSPVSQMIHAYKTDSVIEMSRLVAEIALGSSTIEHPGTYLFPFDSSPRRCIILDHQPDQDDVFTGVAEDEAIGNLVIFGQWCRARARRLG